jgi:hypothetical protein
MLGTVRGNISKMVKMKKIGLVLFVLTTFVRDFFTALNCELHSGHARKSTVYISISIIAVPI